MDKHCLLCTANNHSKGRPTTLHNRRSLILLFGLSVVVVVEHRVSGQLLCHRVLALGIGARVDQSTVLVAMHEHVAANQSEQHQLGEHDIAGHHVQLGRAPRGQDEGRRRAHEHAHQEQTLDQTQVRGQVEQATRAHHDDGPTEVALQLVVEMLSMQIN